MLKRLLPLVALLVLAGSAWADRLSPITTPQLPQFSGGECTTPQAGSGAFNCASMRAQANTWGGAQTFSASIVGNGGTGAGANAAVPAFSAGAIFNQSGAGPNLLGGNSGYGIGIGTAYDLDIYLSSNAAANNGSFGFYAGASKIASLSNLGALTLSGNLTSLSALAKQLQTFASTLEGAICDGNSHLLSASYATLALAQVDYPGATALTQEKDEAAFYSAAAFALASPAVGGEVIVPAGTCRFTAPAAFTIGEGKALKVRGAGLGTRLLFPAGTGNRGLAFTFAPMAASSDSPTLVPSAQVSDLQMVTTATTNAGGGTAIFASNGTATGSQYINNGIPQMVVDHVVFTALNGGGHLGNAGSWTVGFDPQGLWMTSLHDSFFQGGLSGPTGQAPASSVDTTSVFERLTSTGQSTSASNIHVNRNNTMSYGGVFLLAGDTNTTVPLQGIDISSATTVGTTYDVVAQVKTGGDWITIANSNFESDYGSIIANFQTVDWKGNYCIGGYVATTNACLQLNGVGRTFVGAGSHWLLSAPAISVNGAAATATYGTIVLDGNQFSQMPASTASINLVGTSQGVVVTNNVNAGTNPMVSDNSTSKSQLVGWNAVNGVWYFGPGSQVSIDQGGNVTAASLTAAALLQSQGPATIKYAVPTLSVVNTSDSGLQTFWNANYLSAQLGLTNTSASASAASYGASSLAAGATQNVLGLQVGASGGRVGSLTNTGVGTQPVFRNLLDDGAGNASVAAKLSASGAVSAGSLYGTGAAPTLSASTGSVAASTGYNDTHGTLTPSAAQTITVTFGNTAYANPRDCVVTAQNGSVPAYSTTAKVLTITAASTAKITYHCMGS